MGLDLSPSGREVQGCEPVLWGQPTSFQSKGLELGPGSFPLRPQGPQTVTVVAWPLLKGRSTRAPHLLPAQRGDGARP